MKQQKTISIFSIILSSICFVLLAIDLAWHINLNKINTNINANDVNTEMINYDENAEYVDESNYDEVKTQPKKLKLIMESKNKYFETILQESYSVTLNDGTTIKIVEIK